MSGKLTKPEKFAMLYRRIWRWHFYTGLIIIPFMIFLSISGAVYLFKPQIENILDKPYSNLQVGQKTAPPSTQIMAASEYLEGAPLKSYEVPKDAKSPAKISFFQNGEQKILYVNPYNLEILKEQKADNQIMEIAKDIHGELLMGKFGSFFVEGAASFAILMTISGLYLWWPRNQKNLGGILYIRGGKNFVKDLHSVTGFWSSLLMIFLLLSGLPWTNIWGGSFKYIMQHSQELPQKLDWSLNRAEENATIKKEIEHTNKAFNINEIDNVYNDAKNKGLVAPWQISPPNKKSQYWKAESITQNRPLRVTIFYNTNGNEVKREDIKSKTPINQVIAYAIAAHEGQLFGPLNQILGLLTTVVILIISISAIFMWLKRKSKGNIGAPPKIDNYNLEKWLFALLVIFSILLPVFGIILVSIIIIDFLILQRFDKAKNWLGT